MGLSIVLLAGCKEKSHQTEMPAPSISVAMPVVRDITLTKDYPGYLSSDRMVNLVARVNGYLQSSQLVPGAKVKKGDLIFVIEPEVYQNNVTQAEAALNTAKAQVEYARSNYERMKEAAKSGAVSQIQVLQAESTAAEMEASVHNAEAALKQPGPTWAIATSGLPTTGVSPVQAMMWATISTALSNPSHWLHYTKTTSCTPTSISKTTSSCG